MKKTLFLSMLVFFLTTLASFARMDGDPILPTYKIVIIPGDTIGDPEEVMVYDISAGSNLVLENYAFPKRGYELDHWESVKGLSLENIISDDTIIVYFKPSPKCYITVISSDTSMGTVEGDSIYYEEEKVYLNPSAKEGYKYVYWYSKSDPTVKHSGTTFLAYHSDTIICQFIQSSDFGPHKIVALSSDTTKGFVTPINDSIFEGSQIPLAATPNRGFKLDRWESVKGLPYDYAIACDTIYAYFDTLPSYNIVAVSSDTSMGQFYGESVVYEGEKLPLSVLVGDVYLTIPFVKLNDSCRIAYYVSISKGDTITNLYDYNVTCNDTIVAYFEKYTTPDLGNDTLPTFGGNDSIPDAYLTIFRTRRALLDLYGNELSGYQFGYADGDTVIITNKRTGITDTLPIVDLNYSIPFGDTVSFVVKTTDEFKSDSVYTIAYTQPAFDNNVYAYVYLYGPEKKIELEEAEGDSFNVNITFSVRLYNSSIIKEYQWESNGLYAKGDTISIDGSYLNYIPSDSSMKYVLPFEFIIVVNNNIDLNLFSDQNDYMISVKQTLAEKESVVDPYVNVYTINGYLIKQHVLKEEALDGLSKGLYIVGREKVYVNR